MAARIRWFVEDGELIDEHTTPALAAIAERLEAMA
jgi:hypothetical protein